MQKRINSCRILLTRQNRYTKETLSCMILPQNLFVVYLRVWIPQSFSEVIWKRQSIIFWRQNVPLFSTTKNGILSAITRETSASGYATRSLKTIYGTLELQIPRDRLGEFHQQTIPPHKQRAEDPERNPNPAVSKRHYHSGNCRSNRKNVWPPLFSGYYLKHYQACR